MPSSESKNCRCALQAMQFVSVTRWRLRLLLGVRAQSKYPGRMQSARCDSAELLLQLGQGAGPTKGFDLSLVVGLFWVMPVDVIGLPHMPATC